MTNPPQANKPWSFNFMPPWMRAEDKPLEKQPARKPSHTDPANSANLDRALIISATLIALLWSMSNQ